MGAAATLEYPAGGLRRPGTDSLLVIVVADSVARRAIIMQDGIFAGDSIVGTLTWRLTTGRYPPEYHGKFVARKRHF
jgi:hypothetical protein